MVSRNLASLPASRRRFLAGLAAIGVASCSGDVGTRVDERGEAGLAPELLRDFGNFRGVYGDPDQRAAFRDFLKNVFHLYPESELDALIAGFTHGNVTDAEVYKSIERDLPGLAPFLGSVRYALPALAKQKQEMANQTKTILEGVSGVGGYLEVGTHGRYLDELMERVHVRGPVFTTAPTPATYSLVDIVDRGQLALPGEVVAWNDYAGFGETAVEPGSIDLATIYIGLHHAPESARVPYLQSLRALLSPGGRVVVRDHDVTNDAMRSIVGLAHDVFNVGTHESWSTNAAERRNFYSLEYLIALFESQGFRTLPHRLRQAGDPTLNTLLCFQKA